METSKISLMIYIDSLSEVMNLAKKAGIPLAVGPRHYYWGTLEVVIKDPDGVVLVFIEPYSEASAKEMRADETWATKPR